MQQLRQLIHQFLSEHKLPQSYAESSDDHYLPFVDWLRARKRSERPLLLGISGAQGTGKSTLAELSKRVLEQQYGWRVAVLPIDDFYLTRNERRQLAQTVHPLLATRGVPGTHDTTMLAHCLAATTALRDGENVRLPRFDKATDDRADRSSWQRVDGPLNLIVLEGWCVGSIAEESETLVLPVNALERDEDPSADWRMYSNERLREDYMPIFSQLDALVYLRAPTFEAIYDWRLEQERKLADAAPANAPGIMDAGQVARFIQFYERITRNNLARLPGSADVVFELDRNHSCTASYYRPVRFHEPEE